MSSYSGESPAAESPAAISSDPSEEGAGEGDSVSEVSAAAGSGRPEGDGAINYDEAAVVELELDGTDYRLDSGRAGTALCISTRATGTWGWEFRGEARWQNNVLRCKAFDRSVLSELSKALVEISADAG
jgi:hypothetical protein